MNIQTMKRRVDKLDCGHPVDEECEGMWLVRSQDDVPADLPENAHVYLTPRLEVPCRRLKVSEFHSLLDSIYANPRAIHRTPLPLDCSKLADVLRPMDWTPQVSEIQ